jgi:hypothetical protein
LGTIEQPVQNHLNRVDATKLMKARDLPSKIDGERHRCLLARTLSGGGELWLLGIQKQGTGPLSEPVQFDVNRHRHFYVQGGCPEAVIF